MKTHYVSLITANLIAVGAGVAGEFINLNFDSPDLSHLQYDLLLGAYYGTPSDLVPGWTITQDHQPIDRVWFYNQGVIAPATLTALPPSRDTYLLRYNGQSSQAGTEILKTTQVWQEGLIPAQAIGLQFLWAGRSLFQETPLRINGVEVDINSDPQTPHNYYADVSIWAGQTVGLSFDFRAGSVSHLDDLSFVIPEPSTWALVGVGGLALGWACHPRRTRTPVPPAR